MILCFFAFEILVMDKQVLIFAIGLGLRLGKGMSDLFGGPFFFLYTFD